MTLLSSFHLMMQQQQYICIHQCLLAVLEGEDLMDSPRQEIHDNQGYEGKHEVHQT